MEKEVQTDVTKNIENIETQRIEPTQLEVVQNDALTIEEIETGLVYNGSMVRVADISEEFRKVIEPILRMYNAAMNVTTARIEIIKDESRYKNVRCPVHHIDTRLKSAGSILGKLQKKNLDLWRDFLNFPYFTGFPAPLNSEMICIFPYFCPYAESAREIREVFI